MVDGDWAIDGRGFLGPRRTERCLRIVEGGIRHLARARSAQGGVKEIMDEAGIVRTQFYFFFESFDECIAACQGICVRDFSTRLKRSIANEPDRPMQLQNAIQTTVDYRFRHPDRLHVILIDLPSGSNSAKHATEDAYIELSHALAMLTKSATPHVEPSQHMLDTVAGGIQGLLKRSLLREKEDPQTLAAYLKVAVMSACTAFPSEDSLAIHGDEEPRAGQIMA